MSKQQAYVPFFHGSEYQSRDKRKPDIIEFKVEETEIFDTRYSKNAKLRVKKNGKWQLMIVPLYWHEGNRDLLLTDFSELVAKGKLKVGMKFKVKTWFQPSTKTPGREVRKVYVYGIQAA